MRVHAYVLCAAMSVAGLTADASTSGPALVARLPADTIACLTTPDLAELDRRWAKTGLARLWQDDALREFRDSLRQATGGNSTGDLTLLGVSWPQLLEVASGEVCLAIIPVGEHDAGLLLLADVSQHAEQAAKLRDELQGEDQTCFLETGVLGVTNRESLAKPPLGPELGAEGQAGGLAESEAYRVAMERSRAAAGDAPVQVAWYADPWALRARSRDPEDTWGVLADEGFDVVQAVGGVVSLATAEYDAEQHWCVFAPGKRKKAARMLDFSPLDAWELPAWIPVDVGSVACVQWDLAAALVGYGPLFDATYAEGEVGTFEAVLEDIRLEPDGPQVDIPALLELQAGPVLSLSKTGADGRAEVVYAVAVSNQPKVAEALQRMFGPDEGINHKEVNQHEMWVFVEPSGHEADALALGPDLTGYALSAADGFFYVATSASILENILSGQQGPRLAGDPAYAKLQTQAAALRPQHCIGWSVAPSAAGLEPTAADLRSRGVVDLGQWCGDDALADRRVDFSRLPSKAVPSRFLGPGFGFVSQLDDGWRFDTYVLKSGEE